MMKINSFFIFFVICHDRLKPRDRKYAQIVKVAILSSGLSPVKFERNAIQYVRFDHL